MRESRAARGRAWKSGRRWRSSGIREFDHLGSDPGSAVHCCVAPDKLPALSVPLLSQSGDGESISPGLGVDSGRMQVVRLTSARDSQALC